VTLRDQKLAYLQMVGEVVRVLPGRYGTAQSDIEDMTENLAYYPATATQKPTVPTRTASNTSSPQARQLTSQL
jgi:hypothetical protein